MSKVILVPNNRTPSLPHCNNLVHCSAGMEESALDAVAAANVRQLQDMGFTAQQAQQALDENGQDIETALEWLAENCI
mgnify:CR=1 FL=1